MDCNIIHFYIMSTKKDGRHNTRTSAFLSAPATVLHVITSGMWTQQQLHIHLSSREIIQGLSELSLNLQEINEDFKTVIDFVPKEKTFCFVQY